eukprot:CAMPEP_0185040156 /NCGR_PEP_ID=MMETSP1103-20130426/37900_1 /TAXON_ID=36769 /ORGANISM="Paraphysomonas bandaiensis, Strain Caron Lab Isolate" /LENGTH=777 /DNA_ID=CAMNT_0027579339 /DNA_START=148 /DNA_END=2481 /DNA_ORIENTATION=+
MMDGEEVEMTVVSEYLLTQLPRLFLAIAEQRYNDAEIGLSMLHTTKVYFSVFDNIKSPCMLLISCERLYHEFMFTQGMNNSSYNLLDMYSQVSADLNTMYNIFNEEDSVIAKPSESACSSLSSNFSYISLGSAPSGEYMLVNVQGDVVADCEEKIHTPPIGGSIKDTNSPAHVSQSVQEKRFEPLLKMLGDIIMFVGMRILMINVYVAVRSCSCTQATYKQQSRQLRELQRTALHYSSDEARRLLHRVSLEAQCMEANLGCRLALLSAKYVEGVLCCQRLRLRLHEWIALASGGHEDHSADSLSLVHWMCACYRRWVAVIPVLFGEKRRQILGSLCLSLAPQLSVPVPDSPQSSNSPDAVSTMTLSATPPPHPPTASHLPEVNCDISRAVDAFFSTGRGVYRQQALLVVALTENGTALRTQYACPPRDRWSVSSNSRAAEDELGRVSSTESRHSGSAKAFDGDLMLSAVSVHEMLNDNLDDIIPPQILPPRVKRTEAVVLSRLFPSSVSVTSGTPSRGQQAHPYYHTSTRRLLGMVNTTMTHTSSASSMNMSSLGASDKEGGNTRPYTRRQSESRPQDFTASAGSHGPSAPPLHDHINEEHSAGEDQTSYSSSASGVAEAEWIDSHLENIKELLECSFPCEDRAVEQEVTYESFRKILADSQRRKCVCLPVVSSTRGSSGIYIFCPLTNSSFGSTVRSHVQDTSHIYSSPSVRSEVPSESLEARLFVVGAAFHRIGGNQLTSHQYVDDTGRNMSEHVRKMCDVISGDDLFLNIVEDR